ncbi:PHP domain-containing protein [Methanobacterium spitsbergense]|uniref:PHP domain-containing protein n=1 Tax=Methanobacterium spitsbergense TaxID=2874285 RepID=A0A8T5USZ5_9EURY|nr:PHP domain-containing protein [Methanobacterium spitsbergense]MBZ2165096.1 PHP domain-containing protein [Methanobacterium spitsbergense]
MILDPHIHSTYSSDSTASPRDIVKKARSIGLDAIAVADHNTIKGSFATIEEARNYKDFVVVPAMEISSNKGHIVALGIKEDVQQGLSPEETVETIRELGGIAIAAHPFVSYREGLCDNVKELDIDAIETLNSRYVFGYSNWRAKNLAEKRNLPEIGSSDAHFLGAIGSCVTELDANFTYESIIEVILSGKTNVFGDRTPLPLILKEVINKKIKRIG